MERSNRNRNQLPTNLPQLQNLIKRDSLAYRDEFLQQYQHYRALLQLFMVNPSQESKELQELVMFLSQVCSCYRDDMGTFPDELVSLLSEHGPILEPEIRLTLCRGLILMRNKDLIPSQRLLELFFQLFRCQDKILRKALYSHVVADIKKINLRKKNLLINGGLQRFMYSMLRDNSKVTSRFSLEILIQLYKKNIWNDAKTVNAISTACFSPVTKIAVCALRFFLTGEQEDGDDKEDSSSESEDEAHAMRNYIISKQTAKKGKKRKRKMTRALSSIKQKQKRKKSGQATVFSALHLLNDPQDFAEKLFKKLERSKDNFEVRLMMMSLISRLIGLHQLFLFNFYSYLQRYLQPHQNDVTKVLTYLAQACHQLVPPEILEPAVCAIVNNFVTERNSSEVMAVGLNAVREMCARCPLAMSADLLQDLTSYKNYKNKTVMMAARSLIHLYRDINRDMLHRKDRGKPTEANSYDAVVVKEYGEMDSTDIIPGAELIDLPVEDTASCGDKGDSDDDDEEEWVSLDSSDERVEEEIEEEEEEEEVEKEMKEEVEEKEEIKEEERRGKEGGAETVEFMEDREGADVSNSFTSNQHSFQMRNHKPNNFKDHLLEKELERERKLPKEALKLLKQHRRETAALVGTTRFLTQEEFKKIRLKRLASKIVPKKGRKRQLVELLDEQKQRREERGELLSEAAIETVDHARKKHSKEDRMTTIVEGREKREKFGSKKRKFNPLSSSTNKQKRKKKAFTMIKHKRSIKGKNKKSFREKQMALRNSLLKQKRRK